MIMEIAASARSAEPRRWGRVAFSLSNLHLQEENRAYIPAPTIPEITEIIK
jgi:hypothetical protein